MIQGSKRQAALLPAEKAVCLNPYKKQYNVKEDGGEPSSFTLLKRGESLVINQNNL
jgi:hypothetical protein